MKTKVIKLTSNTNVTLTTYIHDLSEEMKNVDVRPAMLIFPGGGYWFCSDREAEPIALADMAKGYNAFVLRYSLKKESEFPKPLLDAEEAISLIRENHKEYNIDPAKVAVLGFSAGGHLAAALGTMGTNKPNALLLGYPCILEDDDKDWPYPIPGLHTLVDEQTPESFVFHTYEDDAVPVANAIEFVKALNDKKIPVEFHLFKTGVHGLSLGNHLVSNGSRTMIDENYEHWFELSVRWLDNIFRSFISEDN